MCLVCLLSDLELSGLFCSLSVDSCVDALSLCVTVSPFAVCVSDSCYLCCCFFCTAVPP